MLKKFNGGRSKRVYYIITGDESGFYSYDSDTKRQSQVWVTRNNPLTTKVLSATYMLAIFFMKSGFNRIIGLENDKIVTPKWHTGKCLPNVLKQVEEKRRRLNDFIIHLDKMHHHTKQQKQWNISKVNVLS